MTSNNDRPYGEIPESQVKRSRLWRKYMRLTRAGVHVLRALDIMRRETDDEEMAAIFAGLSEKMEKGDSMSRAMAAFPDEFSLSEIELVRTAELRGAWDEILTELADGLLDGSFE